VFDSTSSRSCEAPSLSDPFSSQTWFYIAFGLFQLLAAIPLLVLALIDFGIDGRRDLVRALDREAMHGEEEALHNAAWPREEVAHEQAHPSGAREEVAGNAPAKGLDLDLEY
jgi:hypothetical protein